MHGRFRSLATLPLSDACSSQAQAQAQSQEALTELQNRLTAAEGEKAVLEARLAEQVAAQGDAVKALEDKLAALEGEKTTLQTEKTTLQADRDVCSSELVALNCLLTLSTLSVQRLAAREEPIFSDNARLSSRSLSTCAEQSTDGTSGPSRSAA